MHHANLQWFFDNLLPEEHARDLLAADAKLSAADAFGLLAYYGRESDAPVMRTDHLASMNVPAWIAVLSLAVYAREVGLCCRPKFLLMFSQRIVLAALDLLVAGVLISRILVDSSC